MDHLFFIASIVFILVIVLNMKVVPINYIYIIERLGAYHTSWKVGTHIKIPLIDRIARKVSLEEFVHNLSSQVVITKDNANVEIDTVIYLQVVEPKLYVYSVEKPISAIENMVIMTLKNVIGEFELDQIDSSKAIICSKMKMILDEAAKSLGIKINSVEIKNVK